MSEAEESVAPEDPRGKSMNPHDVHSYLTRKNIPTILNFVVTEVAIRRPDILKDFIAQSLEYYPISQDKKVKITSPDPIPQHLLTPQKSNKLAQSMPVQEYMELMRVQPLVKEMIHALCDHVPEDPLAFLAAQLREGTFEALKEPQAPPPAEPLVCYFHGVGDDLAAQEGEEEYYEGEEDDEEEGRAMQLGYLVDQEILRHLQKLKNSGGRIAAEYVWIGGSGWDMRCKSRTLEAVPADVGELPLWNYDGSSTGQAPGTDSEVFMKPAAIFKDPFRGGDNIIVLCDAYVPPRLEEDGTVTAMEPIPTNTRVACAEAMAAAAAHAPWFGIEQEYTLLHPETKWPLGWPHGGYPGEQGPYYCSAGVGRAIGRDLAEAHYKACLHAGVNVSGINAEVLPGQWEYQVGPCEGIVMGDHLWMSRYLMYRVAESFNVEVTFDPKPVPGDWNGSGCHTNYSTAETRKEGTGLDAVLAQVDRLGKKHLEHIAAYGEGNERRLTGKHETASIGSFSWGIANRGCSVRVPRTVPIDKCGYYEDRRPSSNMDPYVVTRMIVQTTLLDGK